MKQKSSRKKKQTRATSALGCDKAKKDSMYKRVLRGKEVGSGGICGNSSNSGGDLIVSDAYTVG